MLALTDHLLYAMLSVKRLTPIVYFNPQNKPLLASFLKENLSLQILDRLSRIRELVKT